MSDPYAFRITSFEDDSELHRARSEGIDAAGSYSNPGQLRRELERHIISRILTSDPGGDPDDNAGQFGRSAFVDPFIVTGRIRRSADPRHLANHKLIFYPICAFAPSIRRVHWLVE